jgi:hypothetical protein
MRATTLFIIVVFAACAFAGEYSLTVYNQDISLVKQKESFSFSKGTREISLQGVPSRIDPTSVHFKPLQDADRIALLEQNYRYDLVSPSKIFERYLDHKIQLTTKGDKFYEGSLLGFNEGQIVIKNGGLSIVRVDEIRDYHFPDLPEGLLTKPTLVWLVESDLSGDRDCEVSYLTKGLNWHAEYVAAVDPEDKNLELSGWVSLDNNSGATYENAKLKLIAGEVHLVEAYPARLADMEGLGRPSKAVPQFEERPFFEYHLYTMTRPATLKDKETKQLSLFPAASTPVKKIYTFESGGYYPRAQSGQDEKVAVTLEFTNAQKQGLGIPLPEGKIRVYKADRDGSLEFVGEDRIDHTPKDEKVRVFVGNAFDIVGERTQKERQELAPKLVEETYEIKLRNHKEEKVEVVVVEHFYRSRDWEITESNYTYTKKDAWTVEFAIPVKPNEESTLEYKVRYRW